jgi:hypothetical protein
MTTSGSIKRGIGGTQTSNTPKECLRNAETFSQKRAEN